MRINSARDDAAGQAIANRMTANINADAVVARGLNDAISYSQSASGGISSSRDLLVQARTLSVQPANGMNISYSGDGDRYEDVTSGDYGQPVQSDSIPATPSDTKTLGLNNTTLLNSDDISTTMKALDSALEKISGYQSIYGAKINRYESNRNVLAQQGVDTSTARSRIQDADYAEEASQLARSQIIQQGQTAVSKMANKTPEMIIQLLGS